MIAEIVVVCTGNICRSPMAEVVLRARLAEAGLDVAVRSSGVSDEELGNPVDPRAAAILSGAGYPVPQRTARVFGAEDRDADLVLAMTRRHRAAILRHGVAPERVRLWMEFVPGGGEADVSDPWYGGRADFLETLALIEAGAPAVVELVGSEST